MNQSQQRQLLLGLLAGATTSLLTIWLQRGRVTRTGLADRIEEVTQQNIRQLGVAAESHFVKVNGLQLHIVEAGPRDGQTRRFVTRFP